MAKVQKYCKGFYNLPESIQKTAIKLGKALGIDADAAAYRYLVEVHNEIIDLKNEVDRLEMQIGNDGDWYAEQEMKKNKEIKDLADQISFLNPLFDKETRFDHTEYKQIAPGTGIGIYTTGHTPIVLQSEIECFLSNLEGRY